MTIIPPDSRNVISIEVLDDDSFINVFRLYRPDLLDEEETNDIHILRGGEWRRERWWYKLVHVCRRWRSLILESASHLGLSPLCTHRTPVADILAHSPPLPLVIDHVSESRNPTPEDHEGIKLALRHHDRVRRIRLVVSVSYLSNLVNSIDKEFPILEHLYIDPLFYNGDGLVLPETFQAPNLRHLILLNFALPTQSSLLATATRLVTLSLSFIPPSVPWHPTNLLYRVSSMPHLQTLGISFYSPVPKHNIGMRVVNTPNMTAMTHVVLPNLRWLGFGGSSSYMEALLPCMVTPRLEKLQILFSNELTISIPNLHQFISSTQNLRFTSAELWFLEAHLNLMVYPREGSRTYALLICVSCPHYDWQVHSAAQMFGILGPVFSTVVNLTLTYQEHTLSSELHKEADRTQWREVLRSFNNVETLCVHEDLVKELSSTLQVHDGESPMELLPELKDLRFYDRIDIHRAFMPFLDARRNAGRPFQVTTLVRNPTPGSGLFEPGLPRSS